MGCRPFVDQEVCRQGVKIPRAHGDDTLGEGRNDRADNFRARLLVGFWHNPDTDLLENRYLGRDLESVVRQIDAVGRIALPYFQNHVDGFGKYLVAVLVDHPQRFRIGPQRARADAHDEPTFGEMVEHGGMGRDQDRMHMREIGRPGCKLDLLGRMNQRRVEQHRVGDAFRFVGQMFTNERVMKPQFIAKNDRFTVLAQHLGVVAVQRMHRHGEVT